MILDFSSMSAEQVLIPRCVECLDVWLPADEEHWQARWTDHGADEKLVFYCPECAERGVRASTHPWGYPNDVMGSRLPKGPTRVMTLPNSAD
jgi:hypothetical protein